MRRTIIEHVAEHAAKTPDKLAVMTAERSLTYAELYRLARGYAGYLASRGVKRGDIVVLRASQTVEYAVQYLGIHLAGAVVTSLGKTLSDEGVAEVAQKVGASMILNDPRGGVLEVAGKFFDEKISFEFPKLEDTADIIFTTGTTGASKGVERTHNTLTAIAESHIHNCEYKDDTVMIIIGPVNHSGPVTQIVASFMNGSSVYLLDGMTNIRAFYHALDYPSTSIACLLPPSAIRVILQLTGSKLGDYRDKIDFVQSESAHLPESDKERLCDLLPNTRLYNEYGASEASSMACYDYNKHRNKINCVGRPMINAKIFIVDEHRNVIKSSKENPGLIACAGDVNMKGYVNDPELTAQTLVNGIVYTNDLGYIDEDGFVYVTGRRDDVINVGGLKVAPTEVEAAALEYDGVEDCVCVAVPDKITGSALKLLVVIPSGELQPAKLSAYLASRLEGYKVPKFYERVEKIARTFNGKIDRKAYRVS
ncbi:MAG: acyl--CoA ligase [Synergistaceae bacterium]|nr:acyl--CoA ligase [Synergistaceae bacterium]